MQAAHKRLGKRIIELRRAEGLSQEAFADSCKANRAHMSLLETGKANPTLATLQKIAKRFGISVSELLKGLF
jgi:putative transcriptional regulator